MNEDPGAPNYDPKHKIIRSLFNGSRGPLLRKATALDWAGDPIEVEGRFRPGHGEHSYDQMLEHFKDYNDIVGDHPQNLLATSLALNAYMLTRRAASTATGSWATSTPGGSGCSTTAGSSPATSASTERSAAAPAASGTAASTAGASR